MYWIEQTYKPDLVFTGIDNVMLAEISICKICCVALYIRKGI